MEILPNGIQWEFPDGSFPLSTDSMALAHFVRLPRNARVLDLGSGCGTLGALLCAQRPDCHVSGIERDEKAHSAAIRNIQQNGLTHRMESICCDLRTLTGEDFTDRFSVCVSNPPYFSGGPAAALTEARREDCCTLQQLVSAAARALRYGGDFYLVHRPERLAEIISCGHDAHLEAKRLRLLRHRQGAPVSLILLQLRKGGKPGLIWEDICLFDAQGDPTKEYNEIYHRS